jgi:hypothetical protein
VLGNASFHLAAPNVENALFGTTTPIALPSGNFSSLQLLGTAVNGEQNSQSITINYTDGSSTTILQNFSDWSSFGNNPNESVAIQTTHRNVQSGGMQAQTFNLYLYKLPINPNKTVASVLLTKNSNVVVLAMTLTSSPAPVACNQGTSANLAGSFNLNGIYTDGTQFSSSALDGGGTAYSANQLGNASGAAGIVIGDVNFQLAAPNGPNALFGTTTPVPLPQGQFATLQMLGTGVNGPQNIQPITINYTDGSSTTILQNFSDWSSFANNPNESVAIQTAYRDLQSGGRQTEPFNLYLYKLPINSSKTVSSVLLTRNSNVVVLAISLTTH